MCVKYMHFYIRVSCHRRFCACVHGWVSVCMKTTITPMLITSEPCKKSSGRLVLQERRRKGLPEPLPLLTNIYSIIHQYLLLVATYRVNASTNKRPVGAKKIAVGIGLHYAIDIGE